MALMPTGSAKVFSGRYSADGHMLVGNDITGNIIFHAPPIERPKPSICIRYLRDEHFVERDLCARILEKCSKQAGRIALVGLGGAGKSQLAVDTCWNIHDRSPDTWVFWVQAGSVSQFEQGYRDVAERLQVTGHNDPDADILAIVRRKLSDEHTGKWLLVVDGADDLTVMLGKNTTIHGSSPGLALSLPISPTGMIVITSRTEEVARGIVSEQGVLVVPRMTDSEAMELVKKRLRSEPENMEDIRDLVKQLDHWPFAISQAIAYINQRAPRLTVKSYTRQLNESTEERLRLLQYARVDPRHGGMTSDSILCTWHVTFQHIQRENYTAGKLLGLLSLMKGERMPDDLVWLAYSTLTGANASTFEDDIRVLRSFDLVHATEKKALGMHRLVQLSTRLWLEMNQKTVRFVKCVTYALNSIFPEASEEAGFKPIVWPQCLGLLPHVEALLDITCDTTACDKIYASSDGDVLYRAALFASATAQPDRAERLCRRLLDARSAEKGAGHEETLWAAMSLSHTLLIRNKHKEAASVLLKADKDKPRSFRDEKWKCLYSARLGRAFAGLEEYDQAKDCLNSALTIARRIPKQELLKAEIYESLARIYRTQRRHEKALPLFERVLEYREQVHDKDDSRCLWRCTQLARAQSMVGDLDGAERLLLNTAVRQGRVLGEMHPSRIYTLLQLARVLQRQGRTLNAIEQMGMVQKMNETVWGPNDRHTTDAATELSKMKSGQGRDTNASALLSGNSNRNAQPRPGTNLPLPASSHRTCASPARSEGRRTTRPAQVPHPEQVNTDRRSRSCDIGRHPEHAKPTGSQYESRVPKNDSRLQPAAPVFDPSRQNPHSVSPWANLDPTALAFRSAKDR